MKFIFAYKQVASIYWFAREFGGAINFKVTLRKLYMDGSQRKFMQSHDDSGTTFNPDINFCATVYYFCLLFAADKKPSRKLTL